MIFEQSTCETKIQLFILVNYLPKNVYQISVVQSKNIIKNGVGENILKICTVFNELYLLNPFEGTPIFPKFYHLV